MMIGSEIFKARAAHHYRIMVVDEADDSSRLSAEVLIDAGYEVVVAEDGPAAWEALLLHRYDLLLTDQFPAKMSGVELVKKIHAANMTLPVIMATRIVPTWEFALNSWLEAVTMLRKPFSCEKLLGVVKNILHANTVALAETRPTPNRQSQPAADPSRL